jgi:hypothetical protein
VDDLSRAYGVEIVLTDTTLIGRTLTFSVDTERRTLSEVLNALALTLDASYVRHGNTISLRAGRRAASHPLSPPKPDPVYGR